MTIVEFITARVTEDEEIATAAIESIRGNLDGDPGEWSAERFPLNSRGGSVVCGSDDDGANVVHDEGVPTFEQAEHIAANDPNSALRRCTLVRAMMLHAKEFGDWEREAFGMTAPFADERIHRDIAAYWSTHPDYRPEWEPATTNASEDAVANDDG